MSRHTANSTRNTTPLEQALTVLIANQVALVAQQAETNKARLESDLEMRKAKLESDLRFARIEKDLDEIKAVLHRLLPELLAKLPEEVSRKIGFKPKP